MTTELRIRAKTDISADKRDASTTEPDMAAFIERTEERLTKKAMARLALASDYSIRSISSYRTCPCAFVGMVL